MTNQYVTITVTEGDKTLTVTREVMYEWPGREMPNITKLIDEVATDVKETIRKAEREIARKAAPGDDLSEPF